MAERSYFAIHLLAAGFMNIQCPKLTLSHWSMPLLVFFPPFCISLSFPTDTALKAKNCTGVSPGLARQRDNYSRPS